MDEKPIRRMLYALALPRGRNGIQAGGGEPGVSTIGDIGLGDTPQAHSSIRAPGGKQRPIG